MKKQLAKKKLILQRESLRVIRTLHDDVLGVVAGGGLRPRGIFTFDPDSQTQFINDCVD